MGKKKNVCPPGIYTSKPYTGTEGTQYEEDGMEHLDQEVNTSICTALFLFHLYMNLSQCKSLQSFSGNIFLIDNYLKFLLQT